MTGAVPLVSCHGVGRTYRSGRGAHTALRDVTCDVWAGDRIAVIGASGSGKSTLLHLIAELDAPTTGVVTWPGLPERPRRLAAGTVGVVFQSPSLVPTLDAVENAALPLVLAGMAEREARACARRVLERLGLGDVLGHLPEHLSGGQAQRVAVGRAVASQPRLVLADEPTGQLDHQTAAFVIDELLAWATPDTAVVLATHDDTAASRLARRWRLVDGRLDAGVPAWR